MPIEVRGATPEDLDALQALYRRSAMIWESTRPLLAQHPELVEPSEQSIARGTVRVAIENGARVGFSEVIPIAGAGELEALFVEPDMMGRGFGKALVEDAVATARRGGCSRLEVTANPNALGFYQRVGFIVIGEAATQFGPGIRMRRECGAAELSVP
jgi:ribosomal protein S18 acetylase RimI-like enzyme